MKRALVAGALVVAFVSLQAGSAGAATPAPCASPSTASAARPGCGSAQLDPNQAVYDTLKARLGGDIAKALTAEQALAAVLDQFSATEDVLNAEVAREESVISNLEDEIARLNDRILDTQARIDVEREQLATMSRSIYRQPNSFWLLIARSSNLREALVATADAVVAGQRAHALESSLQGDLNKLQADRQAKQADLDREQTTMDLLNANLDSLSEVMYRQNGVSGQLQGLIAQIQTLKDGAQNQSPDTIAELAALLEAQEQDLIMRSYQNAWTEAQVGIGLAMINGQLPVGKTIEGLALSWPMTHFTITQVFGPSSVLLEPPFGPYKHFHTGIDIAAPLGTPVMAAADGLVVAVGHSGVGYGNFVVIAHGSGIATLYGHLLQTTANVGDRVGRGQMVGLEGSTGMSTGPHVHFELRVDDLAVDPMPYLPVPGTSWSG